MPTALDDYAAIERESTYGTAVTPTRAIPLLEATDGQWDPRIREGAGVLGGAGRTAMRGSRTFNANGQGTVTVAAELESRDGGKLFDLVFGVSTVTAITGGSVQLFHTQVPDLVLPSATIQLRKIQNTGTARVETFRGCTATKWKITQDEDAIPVIEATFDALGYTTATAAIVPTYTPTSTLFDASQATIGYGGTLVAPTGSTIASGLTSVTNWRKWEIEFDHKANTVGWVLNGGVRSQPKVGMPDISIKATVEFNDNVLPDAYVAGTRNPWYCTWTLPELVGAVPALGQLVIPQVQWRGPSGLPSVTPGEAPRTFELSGKGLSDGTNRDILFVYRTANTAL